MSDARSRIQDHNPPARKPCHNHFEGSDVKPSERAKRVARGILVVLLPGIVGVVVYVWERNRLAYQALECLRQHGFAASFQEMAPPPVPDDENAAPLCLEAFARWVTPDPEVEEIEEQPLDSLSPGQRTAVESAVARNRGTFELLRRARSRPRCRFERDYEYGQVFRSLDWGRAIGVGRWIGRKAELEAAHGDSAEARESIRDLLALAEGFRDEPFVMTQYVRLGLVQQGLVILARLPLEGAWEAWLDLLPPDNRLEGLAELAMRGELALAADLVRDPGRVFWLAGDPQAPRGMALAAPLFRIGSGETLHRLLEMAKACRLPYPQSAVQARRLNPPSLCLEPVGFDFAKLHLVALGTFLDRQAGVQAALAVTRAGLEFELAREREGRYPTRLQMLDPCSGSPLLLNLAEGSISSVGVREQDMQARMKAGLVWRLRHGP